jgi:1-acyl-sn-glycerol-3-phosphate acyltransferase
METGTPILPVVITGTHLAIRKGSLLIHKNHNIRLTILDPIPFEAFSHLELKEVTSLVHALTVNQLQRIS